MQHVDAHRAAGRQRVEHDATDDRDEARIDDRARPDQPIDLRLALLAPLHVDVGIVADQGGRTADLLHDRVAGVDAQAALDATELDAIANVDPRWADIDALMAVDAVAGRLPVQPRGFRLLDRHARLATIALIGDVERPFVGQRGLDARPRAHVDTDLLA